MSKDDFFQRLFSSIGDSFQHNQFCDVQLHGRRSKLDFTLKSVSCHSLVLCSVAPAFTSGSIYPKGAFNTEHYLVSITTRKSTLVVYCDVAGIV